MEWETTNELLEMLNEHMIHMQARNPERLGQGNKTQQQYEKTCKDWKADYEEEVIEPSKQLREYRYLLLKTPSPVTQRFSELRAKLTYWYVDHKIVQSGAPRPRSKI